MKTLKTLLLGSLSILALTLGGAVGCTTTVTPNSAPSAQVAPEQQYFELTTGCCSDPNECAELPKLIAVCSTEQYARYVLKDLFPGHDLIHKKEGLSVVVGTFIQQFCKPINQDNVRAMIAERGLPENCSANR